MQLTYNGLDLNASPYGVALNGFLAPPPTIKQQFADSALRHGQVPTEAWKYNNRLLTFAVRVSADTRAELDDAIRALEAEVYEATSLVAYTIDDGQTIYFRAYRPSETDPTAYFDRRYQDALTCIISWSQEAYPFGHIDRMALPLVRGLGRNDSFERREGNDFEDWVEDASGGSIAANTTDYIAGVTSAKLTAGAGLPTSLTDEDFIYVDSSHHHNLKLYCHKDSGTASLDLDLMCYDANGDLLDTITILEDYDPPETTWLDAVRVAGEPVVYPEGSQNSPSFPVGTAKVKRQIRHDGNGVISIDSLYLGDTEYIVGHELEAACAILVPPGICAGDVPSLARLSIGSAYDAGPFSPVSSGTTRHLHAIHGLDESNVWAVGAHTALYHDGTTWTKQSVPSGGYYYTVHAIDANNVWAGGASGAVGFFNGTSWTARNLTYQNIVTNGGFEDGAVGSIPPGWSLIRGGQFTTAAYAVEGSKSGKVIYNDGEGAIYTSIPVVAGRTYSITAKHLRSTTLPTGAPSDIWMYVFFEDSAENIITSHLFSIPATNKNIWYTLSGSATAPAGAVTASIRLWPERTGSTVYWDAVSVKQTSRAGIYGISSLATDDVFAVGQWGEIHRYTTAWEAMDSGHDHTLHFVHAVDSNHVYAVGDDGCISFYDGTSWSHQHVGTKHLRDICEVEGYLFVVGYGGTIYCNNGTGWLRQTSGTTQDLYAVYGYDFQHVYAVGANGTILEWNGYFWSSVGSGTGNVLRGVYAVADERVWACGLNGTLVQGIDSIGAMPVTDLIIAQRDQYADDWSPVQDAGGDTQVLLWSRRGQHYRNLAAGASHKFRFPVGTHAGRYILSMGLSWASSTVYDQLSVTLYLETVGGVKISPADIDLDPLDMDDPNTNFREVAFQTVRFPDITIPSHYVSPSAARDNIYQVIEVTNNALSPAMMLDCCTLIPADRCLELPDLSAKFVICESEEGMALSSIDGSLDTAAVIDPTKTVDAPRFEADPNGMNMVILFGNDVDGDQRLDARPNISISWEPQWLMIPSVEEEVEEE